MSLEEYQKELWKQEEEKEAIKKRAQKAKLDRLKNNPLLKGLYQKELEKSREEIEVVKEKTVEKQYYVRDSLIPQMKDIITYSLEAVKDQLLANKTCFELFGYDFIVDQNGKVFLIEINTNPSLEESSKFLTSIITRMIHDMFKLTIDLMFPLNQEHKKLIEQEERREN